MQDHPQYDLLTRSTVSDLPEADSDMSLRPALPSSLPLLFRSAPIQEKLSADISHGFRCRQHSLMGDR